MIKTYLRDDQTHAENLTLFTGKFHHERHRIKWHNHPTINLKAINYIPQKENQKGRKHCVFLMIEKL